MPYPRHWGLSPCGWAWEARLADFDKGKINRWPEMQETALANDQLIEYPETWHNIRPDDDIAGTVHNTFFVRAADGRYYDIAPNIGLGKPMCTRANALADVDGDERLDLALANN